MTRIASGRNQTHGKRAKLSKRATVCLVILSVTFLFFFVVNVSGSNGSTAISRTFGLRGTNNVQWVSPVAKPFNDGSVASNARNLVIVAGHSVIVSGNLEEAENDEDVWYLLDHQIGKGLPKAIVSHIRAGILTAAYDPDSLLIFSGGETRGQTGPANEGESYFRVADALNLWDAHEQTNVRARTTTEEFATDSFQNLLFSICRFREVTGSYPDKISVVSFTFKRRRFEELHAWALLWPDTRFEYIGVDPPASSGFDLEESQQGELENAARPFESDPYGCYTSVLQQKRKDRNPFSRTPPYILSCPDMASLLSWCGPELIPRSEVPWAL